MSAETDEKRAALVDAYNTFATAAFKLEAAIEALDNESEDCAENYPFQESFDEVTFQISHWRESAIRRLDPNNPMLPEPTED